MCCQQTTDGRVVITTVLIYMPCSCCRGLLKPLAEYDYTEELSFFVVEERKVAVMNIKHRRGRNKNENKWKIKQPGGGGVLQQTHRQKLLQNLYYIHSKALS